jgi:preprotein translocase subunit SecA
MITKSIERAQKKVEENNFGQRKHLLEYDDVMNSQREVIYTKRRHALYGERLSVDINNMAYDVSEEIVLDNQEGRDYEGFKLELLRTFSIEPQLGKESFYKEDGNKLSEQVYRQAMEKYKRKSEFIAETSLPVIRNVFENQSATYENIVVPFSDGIKTLQVIANLKKSYDTQGKELVKSFEKNITLAIIDEGWKEHLRELDDLRQSVQQARYEQKDPLLIYKLESFNLFKQFIKKINVEIVSFLFKGNIPAREGTPESAVKQVEGPKKTDYSQVTAGRPTAPEMPVNAATDGQAPNPQAPQRISPVRAEKKVGRNEPCPCGSGKKFKQCHGQ